MTQERDFWYTIEERIRQVAPSAAPPYLAFAVTTGDPPENVTVGSLTTRRVTVWLNGAPQTDENKVRVTLGYEEPVPGPGEYWLVLLSNYGHPGVLLKRLG